MILKHKDWDINEHTTGRFKDGKAIIGAIFQNGLNDKEPDGSFVPCDMEVEEYQGNVTTHKIKRGRYGRLSFTDSASVNKHLCKLIEKSETGLSFKYIDGDSDLPNVSNGKPSFISNNGVIIEHTPTHKGVRIELVINAPSTAPIEYNFSIKKYKQDYTFAEQNDGIVATGENGKKITIHAPYAIDANGETGPVSMMLTEMIGGYQTFKKIVDETWLRQAAAPVRIDPNITIDDDNGTFIDTIIAHGASVDNNNLGLLSVGQTRHYSASDIQSELMRVDLSPYSGNTVTYARFGIDNHLGIYPVDIAWHRVLKEWIEGTKVNALASTEEPTWLSQKHGQALWTTSGCLGDGTDRQAVEEGSKTILGIGFDHQLVMTNVTVQAWLDDVADNHGIILETPNSVASRYIQWRSSEATTGNKPYFYMEYTEGVSIALSRSRLINMGGTLGGLTKSTLNNLGGA